jgi:cytosine/adenosine deaminase-related metal-dependent hydrolase
MKPKTVAKMIQIHLHETPSEVLAVEQRMRAAAAPHPVKVFTMELSAFKRGTQMKPKTVAKMIQIHVHETPSEVLTVEQRMRAAAAPHPVNVFTMELSVSGHGIRITETEAAQEHLLA